jgi:hypothetical protein
MSAFLDSCESAEMDHPRKRRSIAVRVVSIASCKNDVRAVKKRWAISPTFHAACVKSFDARSVFGSDQAEGILLPSVRYQRAAKGRPELPNALSPACRWLPHLALHHVYGKLLAPGFPSCLTIEVACIRFQQPKDSDG